MDILILTIASGLLVAGLSWIAIQWVQRQYANYRSQFKEEAVHGLADFFLFLDPGQLWGVTLLLAAVPASLTLLMGGPLAFALATGAGTLALPRFVLHWARRRRRKQVDAQLPDFLLSLAGALRAGSSLQAGLRQVIEHTDKPLAQELALLLQQQRMGVPFNDALDALQTRIGTESIGLMVAAIKVAGHTGGSLAETLERISRTVRMRLQLMAKVGALTAQGRMQAWVMAALPGLLALALQTIDPQTMSLLWRTPMGWTVLGLVGVLEIVGIMLVRRIVTIEV